MMYKELQEMRKIEGLINGRMLDEFSKKDKEEFAKLIRSKKYDEAVFVLATKINNEIKVSDLFYLMRDMGFSTDVKSKFSNYLFTYNDEVAFVVSGFTSSLNNVLNEISINKATELDLEYIQ